MFNPVREMRIALMLAGLVFFLAACSESHEPIGGNWIRGNYSALVDLDPAGVGHVRVDIYEDFTCPACQNFEGRVIPVLQKRYGSKLDINRHFLAAPSTQLSPLVLYTVADRAGRGSEMASLLMRAKLENKNSPENDEIVRRLAVEAGLDREFQRAMTDEGLSKFIRAGWTAASHKVASFPQVVIQNEIATGSDQDNLIEVLDSVIEGNNR